MSSDKIQQPPARWIKAASTSVIPTAIATKFQNSNVHQEENASSAINSKATSETTTTGTKRSNSPRKLKTQVAKLVYNPSSFSSSKSIKNDVNENEKTVKPAEVAENFQKKRQDRDKEVKEIQQMLNEITKTPTKQKPKPTEEIESKKVEKIVKTTQPPPQQQPKKPPMAMQRSKTDLNIIRRPNMRKIQPKQESQTARGKAAQVAQSDNKNSPQKQRQKAYSSEEAQRFMQEQKKKRRSLQTTTQDTKAAIDKDEIKKRLENLRLNSRKIVDKNIKQAKKKSTAMDYDVISQHENIREETNKKSERELEKASNPPTSSRRGEEVGIELTNSTNRTDAPSLAQRKSSPEKSQNSSPLSFKKSSTNISQDLIPLAENHKKIGLLRKPELKDHSFSAIKDIHIDKENFILENLTPQISSVPSSKLTTDREPILSNPLSPQIEEQISTRRSEFSTPHSIMSNQQNMLEKPSASNSLAKTVKRRSSQELDLKIPQAKLETRNSGREKSVQADSVEFRSAKIPKTNNELPYWLKPTLVQAYPYNFIMAVRKKLESIANPTIGASSSSSSIDQQMSKKTFSETPVAHSKTNKNNHVKRRIMDHEDEVSPSSKSVEMSSANKENIGESEPSPRSYTEITSNFSSTSIRLPESNKHVKPKPHHYDEDATTVSSSIFSSPEKKKNLNKKSDKKQLEALSPLSMENISNLHIKSKPMTNNITLERGDNFNSTSSHRSMTSGSSTNRSGKSVDFSQLLDDFNRSLTQVIEVNQQLKTTLGKSQIFSPEKKKTNSVLITNHVELTEYVSDFEEESINSDVKTESKERFAVQSSSTIPEVQESSKKTSEINTEKSSLASSSNEEVIEEEESHRSTKNHSKSSDQSSAFSGTQTFVVSTEEKGHQSSQSSQSSKKIETIHEQDIEESPNKENMSGNQYSLDSLEISQQDDYVKSHINISRGDYERIEQPPPGYKISAESQKISSQNVLNSSMDSEFVRIFNKSDMEISVMSLNNSLSESTVNYSSIGMYEKLIQNETNKSEHLAALLKMREKALIDRTKGQIAWLEVQKGRYKSKGLILQTATIKKKQRGILLKMEKEREEIKKLLQQTKIQRDDNKLRIPEIRPFSDVTLLQQQRRTGIQVSTTSQHKRSHQNHQQQHHHQHQYSAKSKTSSTIVRGFELETSRSLEQLLQKREEDLRRRREHVERLMEWHRRLDQEEAEVLQLEKILLDYNNVHVEQAQQIENVSVQERNQSNPKTKMEKKLKDIDRSLRELSSISGADGGSDVGVGSGEFVRTSGTKLNKLWRRLTSQRIEKFQPNKKYKLCKADIEQIYEDAKLAVLNDFGDNADQIEEFLGHTSIISTPQPSNHSTEIPRLNLNFSSGHSEEDIMLRGNYSPSAAEEGYAMPSTSSLGGLTDDSCSKLRGTISNFSSSATRSMPDLSNSKPNHLTRLENVLENDNESISFNLVRIVSPKNKTPSLTELESEPTASMKSSVIGKQQLDSQCETKTKIFQEKDSYLGTDSEKSNHVSLSTKSGTRSIQMNGYENTSTSMSLVKNSVPLESMLENHEETLHSQPVKTPPSLSNNINTIPELSNAKNSSNNVETLISQQEMDTLQSLSEISITSALEKSSGNSEIQTNTRCSTDEDTKVNDEISEIVETHNTTQMTDHMSNGRTASDSQNGPSISIESQTFNSAPKSSSAKVESIMEQKQSKSELQVNSSTKTETEHCKINSQSGTSNKNEVHSPFAEANRSLKSSDECASVSILESLLNSTYNINTMFASSQASTPVNEMEAQLRSNDRSFNNWTNSLNESNEDFSPSTKDEQSIATQVTQTEPETHQDETTLRSIKSIEDNSTNSKHSTDPVSNQTIVPSEEDVHSNQVHDSKKSSEDVVQQSYSSAFEDSVSSKQLRSSVIMSVESPPFQAEVEPEPLTNVFYESDFTEGDETNIDDISLPKFETTIEEDESQSNSVTNKSDLEHCLNNSDVSQKDQGDATFVKTLSPEKSPSPSRDDGNKGGQQQNDSALMPDIISEVELRRRHQAFLENESKQFEHAVPYMYVREIPNKPPPPYVPPAHGSPMTTIFPSEERIKDITFRRTKELYHEILNIEIKDELSKKQPSVLDENITNIYERIILDICKEYLTEYKPILTSSDPNNFHSSLAFFNPPDRLKCIQDFIYKEVRKNLAMDKIVPEKNQLYSVYGHRGKRDHVGEIIIQEMFEEDNIWSNFYYEEEEVLELIIEEILSASVRDICTSVLEEETAAPRDSNTPAPETNESVEAACCNNST